MQSDEILNELRSFPVDCEDNCLFQFIDVIWYAHNLDKFYPMFYKIVTQIESIHGLSKKSSIVVGFELANHVIGYYKKSETVSSSASPSLPIIAAVLNERDVSVVTYISGYVFSIFYRRLRKSLKWETDLFQQKLALLKAGQLEPATVESDQQYRLVRCRDRGGLWYVRKEVISIFAETEKEFQKRTVGFFTKIPFDAIVKAVVDLDNVQSSIKYLQSHSLCDVPFEDETLNNFLYDIVLLYVRVRAHSTAKDTVMKHRQTFKVSSGTSLRKELKRSSLDE